LKSTFLYKIKSFFLAGVTDKSSNRFNFAIDKIKLESKVSKEDPETRLEPFTRENQLRYAMTQVS